MRLGSNLNIYVADPWTYTGGSGAVLADRGWPARYRSAGARMRTGTMVSPQCSRSTVESGVTTGK